MWFTEFMDREKVLAKLWAKTEVHPESGCWIWTGAKTSAGPKGAGGYGEIMVDGLMYYTHRLSHEINIGPIPPRFVVDHVRDRGCISKACWRPEHLEAVTQRVNIVDRGITAVSAINARKTHCINGHEFTHENTLLIQNGRRCRRCSNARKSTPEGLARRRAWRAANRERLNALHREMRAKGLWT